jgi:hypothetical protein
VEEDEEEEIEDKRGAVSFARRLARYDWYLVSRRGFNLSRV